MTRPPPRSPLFPYTTLFRSHTSELQSHSHLVCRLLEFRRVRSEEHTSELQSHSHLVCRLLLEKKKALTVSPPPRCCMSIVLISTYSSREGSRSLSASSASSTERPTCVSSITRLSSAPAGSASSREAMRTACGIDRPACVPLESRRAISGSWATNASRRLPRRRSIQ